MNTSSRLCFVDSGIRTQTTITASIFITNSPDVACNALCPRIMDRKPVLNQWKSKGHGKQTIKGQLITHMI